MKQGGPALIGSSGSRRAPVTAAAEENAKTVWVMVPVRRNRALGKPVVPDV